MKRIFLSALPIILPLSAYADLPLTIEDMMTDKGKLETGNFPYLPEQRKQPHQTCRASLHPNRRNLVYPHSDRNPRKRQQYRYARRHARFALRTDRQYRYLRQRQLSVARRTQTRQQRQNPQQTDVRHIRRHQPHLPQRRQKPRTHRFSRKHGLRKIVQQSLVGKIVAHRRHYLQSHRSDCPFPYRRLPYQRQQNPFRRHPLQIGQLPAAQPQHLICHQRQNQPDRRHPMVEQAARPDGKTGILRKHIHLRPFRRRFRLHPNHSFKRIRAFQRFMAKQFRTEIWRTAYILSRF